MFVEDSSLLLGSIEEDVSLLLRTAIVVLDRDGWCQRQLHAEDGSHCLAATVGVARREVGATTQVHKAALERLRLGLTGAPWWSGTETLLSSWNDLPTTTVEDVRAKLVEGASEVFDM